MTRFILLISPHRINGSLTMYSFVIFSHRYLNSDCINLIFLILYSWLFIGPSEHHHTTQTQPEDGRDIFNFMELIVVNIYFFINRRRRRVNWRGRRRRRWRTESGSWEGRSRSSGRRRRIGRSERGWWRRWSRVWATSTARRQRWRGWRRAPRHRPAKPPLSRYTERLKKRITSSKWHTLKWILSGID